MRFDIRSSNTAFRALITTACIGLSLVFYSEYIRHNARKELETRRDELMLKRQQVQHAKLEKHIVEANGPEFLSLFDEGHFQKEDRLSWVETLKHHTTRLNLPHFKYRINAREFVPIDNVNAGNHAVYMTPMKLELGMLHEMDLLTLTDGFFQEKLGVLSVDRCAIERVTEAIDLDADIANIQASCTLSWYSFDTPPEDSLHELEMEEL